jgi:uncharacterized membrane protein YkvA (DUF1232 family)
MATARSRFVMLTSFYRATRIAMRPGGPSMSERLWSVPRLFSSTLSGRYAGASVGRLAMMAGAVAYVISPIDLVPEGALLLFGVLDDAVVLSWLAAAIVTETESFLSWERGTAPAGAESDAWLTVPSVVTTDTPTGYPGAR